MTFKTRKLAISLRRAMLAAAISTSGAAFAQDAPQDAPPPTPQPAADAARDKDAVTLEEALALIEAKIAKGGGKPKKAAKKKAAPKKTAAKTGATKTAAAKKPAAKKVVKATKAEAE